MASALAYLYSSKGRFIKLSLILATASKLDKVKIFDPTFIGHSNGCFLTLVKILE